MGKIKITLVDSEVRSDHPAFQKDVIKGFTYLENGEICENFEDTFGHGTAIYGIVRRVKEFADITNIRIPNIEEGIDCDALCSILNYIADNIETDLLNLSLGVCVCDDLRKLKYACERLEEKNVIVIAAFDNAGSVSYPAAFSNVIGVTTGERCRKFDEFEYQMDEIVNLAAKGSVQRLAWLSPDYVLLGGNSFACAHVTTQAAIYMAKNYRTRESILQQFRENSVVLRKKQSIPKGPEQLFPITTAALFPFCKEMHSLLRFYDMLNFRISDIYDVKYAAKVGASTRFLMKDNDVPDFIIKNVDKIEWDNFDTLIIGHLQELSLLIDQQNLLLYLLQEASNHQKKIVAFDDLTDIAEKYSDVPIYYPRIDSRHLPPDRFGKLYRSSKPTIGVFGTSSRQGKFTLQLILRRNLLQRGYRIGQLGTEPSSLLYGMDAVYPMGYNSSVYLTGFDAIRYLNNCINRLCEKDADLIIVGSQSGTVPYDTGNIEQYTCSQYDFLMGTLPDAVILCINPYDELEYIQRTIRFIESAIESKVLALTLFPLDLKDEWKGIYGGKKIVSQSKADRLKNDLGNGLNLPVFLLGDKKDMNDLTDNILDYFMES